MKRVCMILTLMGFFAGRGLFCGEPIMFIAIEKSASVTIQWQLIKSLGYEFRVVDQKDAEGLLSIINQDGLAACANKNCVLRGHYFPTRENIDLLKKHHIKAIFHVRDLRQRVLSFAHHWLRQLRAGQIHIPGLTAGTATLNDVIEHLIPNVKLCVSMIEGWLEVYERGELPMMITTYEEFHDNSDLFFSEILNFYGIPLQKFRRVNIPKNQNYHFRKGEKDEWKRVLTPDQIRRVNEQIPTALFDFFGWE